jgi:hypothetical protein
MGVLQTFLLRLAGTLILLSSASCIAWDDRYMKQILVKMGSQELFNLVVLSPDIPDLSLSRSWDYRREPQAPALATDF